MVTRERLAEILLETSAVIVNTAKPLEHARGLVSPVKTDFRFLTCRPLQRDIVIKTLIEHIADLTDSPEVIVATGLPSIALATLVAKSLKLPLCYVRSSAKSHGKGKQIEGLLPENCRAVVIHDVISTETDVRTCIEALKERSVKVVRYLSILDSKIGVAERFLKRNKIPFISLTDLQTLQHVAETAGRISSAERAEAQAWVPNTEAHHDLRQQRLQEEAPERHKDVAGTLLRIGAITLSPRKPYRFASGVMSPIYTDNRLLMSYPNEWKHIIDYLVSLVVNEVGVQNLDLVAGVATSGISHAAYLAHSLNIPMTYVEAATKLQETQNIGRDTVQGNERILLVEDLISTGASAISAAQILRSCGANVDYCVAIFSYDFPESEPLFRRHGIKLLALSNLESLLRVAEHTNGITPSEKAMIEEWVRDPQSWGKEQDISKRAQEKDPL